MTEQEAHNTLYDLWESGELPSNFDENHSDYDKAVKYTMKHGRFDIDNLYEDMSIIKFGIWQVESDALVAKSQDYIIDSSRFWETSEYNGHLVWDWLIHLASKAWINNQSVKDLNTAFFFCQDYFKNEKPSNLPYVSTAQTLYIQKQLLDNREEMNKYPHAVENGIVQIDTESMLKYRSLKANIKTLEL